MLSYLITGSVPAPLIYQIVMAKPSETMDEAIRQQDSQGNASERYLLVEWIKGQPIIDGAKYADTRGELVEYLDQLTKLPNSLVEYAICRIYNVR